MYVDAIVNGEPKSASRHVTTTDCATDSVLDDPEFQRGLREIYDSSNVTAPVAQPREWGGYMYRSPDSTFRRFVVYRDPNAEPCRYHPAGYLNGPPLDSTLSGGWIIGGAHSHPIPPGVYVPAGVCPQYPNGGYGAAGPSGEDVDWPNRSGEPGYVIDNRRVWRVTPDKKVKSWPRKKSGCWNI
jgi:hypothetical protein